MKYQAQKNFQVTVTKRERLDCSDQILRQESEAHLALVVIMLQLLLKTSSRKSTKVQI